MYLCNTVALLLDVIGHHQVCNNPVLQSFCLQNAQFPFHAVYALVTMTVSLASTLSQLYSGMSGMFEMCQKPIAAKRNIVIKVITI